MKLLDFMCIDAIQVDLQSSEKEDVIKELVPVSYTHLTLPTIYSV